MLICLLGVASGIFFSNQHKSPENQLIRDGHELLNNGKIEQAEAKFDEARRLAPKSADPWYWKARVSLKGKHRQGAIEYLNKALKIKANHEPSLVLKIKILLLSGGTDSTKARTIAKQSYDVSASLKKWVNCLEKNNVFSDIITESKLDELCPSPDHQ